MASIRLNFVKPETENLEKLLIYEAASKNGVYTLIETVTDIGTDPDYISFYTTDHATSITDWFAIEWEDDKGARSPRSNPIQGNTTTAVGELVKRMMLRDPSISEEIATQEAEILLSQYFQVDDPYTIDPATVSYVVWGGLTYLGLARTYVSEIITTSSGSGYTAGIIAQQASDSTQTLKNVKDLVDLGNKLLGINYSYVLQMQGYDPYPVLPARGVLGDDPGFFGIGGEIDASRLLVEIL